MAKGDATLLPCADCGGTNTTTARFCQHCGARLEGPAPDRRKVVTVVFCDVTGSTTLGERLDPEVLRTVMGEFYDRARGIVLRHQGSVEKFIGDAVVAVFGVPIAREDDAFRAIRAAVEIHSAVAELSVDVEDRYGVGISVRVGINTGEVVVGEARAGGSFATGDAVNTAARLEQAAEPGETVIGQSTYELARHRIDAAPLEPLTLRNKQDAVAAYRLTGLRAEPEARAEAPFVGRVRELALLADAFARARESETAAIVTVIGDAGLGKSRLVAEALADVRGNARVLSGRCLSYGDGITFWPVVEVLRTAMASTGSEDHAEIVARLGALAGDSNSRAVVAQLGPLLGLGGEPGSIADVTWAVQTIIERLAEESPVVLDLDDLHWAEPGLLDLLETVVRACRDLPVLLICQARPEFLAQRPTWGNAVTNATTLQLEPLPDADAAALIKDLGGADDTLAQRIRSAAGGNPLFVEQLVAYVRAGNVEGGAPRVPPTLAALIAARLDQLNDPERSVVSSAAIVGQVFHTFEVAAVDPTLSESELASALQKLSERQIVRRSRADGPSAYRFRHALVQDAAYQAQPKAQRAQRHQRYAEWLHDHPTEAAGEIDAIRGWHLEQAYLLAHEIAPADNVTATLARDGAEALYMAARLRATIDTAGAAGLMRRAAALTVTDQNARTERLLRAALLAWRALQIDAAKSAIDAVDELGDDIGPAAISLANAMRELLGARSGRPAGTVPLLDVMQRTYDECDRSRWIWGRAAARRLQVDAYNILGAWAPMTDLLDDAIRFADAVDDVALRDDARMNAVAIARWGTMPVDDALVLCDRVIEQLQDAPASRLWIMYAQGALLAMSGRTDEGRAQLRPRPSRDNVIGYTHWGFAAYAAEALAGDDQEAAGIAEDVAANAAATGDIGYSSTLYGIAAYLYASVGNHDRARALTALSRESTLEDDAISQSVWRLGAAITAAHDGNVTAARDLLTQSIAWMDRSDQLNEQAEVRWYAAPAFRRIGEDERSRQVIQEALERYRRKGNVVMIGRCEEMLASH